MEKLELRLNTEELESLNYNKENMRNLIISRAIYNDSLDYEFNTQEMTALNVNIDTLIIRAYLDTEISPKIMVNENEIIEKYNENKALFEKHNVAFKDAREMVKNELVKEQAAKLENDILTEIVNNMGNEVKLTKNELLYSSANAEEIKRLLINKIVLDEIASTSFLQENKEKVEIIKQEARMNLYTRVRNIKDIKVFQKEVEDKYEENKKDFENVDKNQAMQQVYSQIFEEKFQQNVAKYIEELVKENNIDELIEELSKKGIIN